MERFDTRGEKFSGVCAATVFGVLTRHKRCSVRTVCEETGLSKVSAGRVLSFFERNRTVRKYGYRPLAGRGRKPDEYYLHPKTSSAVLDLRAGEMNLYIYSLPSFKTSVISPKILQSRPLAEKADVIRRECFPALFERIPPKYLVSVSVVSDKVFSPPEDIPDDFARLAVPGSMPEDTFFFASEELEAEYFGREFPGKKILLIHISEYRNEALVLKDGNILYSEDLSAKCGMANRKDMAPPIAAKLALRFEPDEICVFTPFASTFFKEDLASSCRALGIPDGIGLLFADGDDIDIRKEAVMSTVSSLTGKPRSELKEQELII